MAASLLDDKALALELQLVDTMKQLEAQGRLLRQAQSQVSGSDW